MPQSSTPIYALLFPNRLVAVVECQEIIVVGTFCWFPPRKVLEITGAPEGFSLTGRKVRIRYILNPPHTSAQFGILFTYKATFA